MTLLLVSKFMFCFQCIFRLILTITNGAWRLSRLMNYQLFSTPLPSVISFWEVVPLVFRIGLVIFMSVEAWTLTVKEIAFIRVTIVVFFYLGILNCKVVKCF